MTQNAQMKAKHAHTIYGPAHKLRINSLCYIIYCMLEQVLELTSSSPTCFTPGEQIEKYLHYLSKTAATARQMISFISFCCVWISFIRLSTGIIFFSPNTSVFPSLCHSTNILPSYFSPTTDAT